MHCRAMARISAWRTAAMSEARLSSSGTATRCRISGPGFGGTPELISTTTTPAEKTSSLGLLAASSSRFSGAIYTGVPATVRTVTVLFNCLASPKSASSAFTSSCSWFTTIRMFAGLMSR